jgi:hypothetical protein
LIVVVEAPEVDDAEEDQHQDREQQGELNQAGAALVVLSSHAQIDPSQFPSFGVSTEGATLFS